MAIYRKPHTTTPNPWAQRQLLKLTDTIQLPRISVLLMFDEFVEHTTQTRVGSSSLASLHVQYEGFEPEAHPFSDIDLAHVAVLNAPPPAPIFEVNQVQYAFSAPLVAFAVSSDVVTTAFASNLIEILELSHAEQIQRIQIPRKPTEMTIYKIFIDPSGRHLLITSTLGENWYIYRHSKKPRQLKGFKMVIESVAWNKPALLSASHSTSTREFLVGGRNGTIYEAVLDAEDDFFKSQERYLNPVYSLPERHPITGLRFDFFPPHDPKRALVIATTPTRIYQFIGNSEKRNDDGGRFTSLFNLYRDTVPKILELPSELQRSELQFFTQNAEQVLSLPQALVWVTGPGIYHGTLNFDSTSDNMIDSAQLLPYPTHHSNFTMESPISVALSEFHFILAYKNHIAGVNILNEVLAYEETLPVKSGEEIRGVAVDPIRKTYWVYTNQSLYELSVGNEDRDVWEIYLARGQYDLALRYAKTATQRDRILTSQAQALFDLGKFFQSAQCYAQCSVSFEDVALKFIDASERDAMRSYLISRLERTRKADVTQRMMLATWLVEFYLSKCNELDDIVASESVSHDVDNLQTERAILEDELRQFFDTYKHNLDRDTTYELIQGHGRTDMYLYYATTIGDFGRVVDHWILEERWPKALDVINRQGNLELYYRFAPILIRQVPKETVDSWIKQPALDPLRLVSALLQLQQTIRDPLSPNYAIRYLNHLIFKQGNTSPIIHNLVVTFHVCPSSPSIYAGSAPPPQPVVDDGPLLKFLSTAPSDPIIGKPYYDLDYALRLCKNAGCTQACVHIYSKMGLWENSVDLALEKGDLELAVINAKKPEDDTALMKKLWLKVARYVVQDKKDIKSAMRFLETTEGLLKIEDILPFFPDFVVIDDFKEEIAHALEGYSAHIDVLKGEMNEATKTAESIKEDIGALKKRFVTIDAGERCSVCSQILLTRQFYVFPCRHKFHADCLIGLAKEYLPPHVLRKILALQNELVKGNPIAKGTGGVTVSGASIGNPMMLPPTTQRPLLSANFASPLQNGARAANLLGRSVMSAGDRLRDLIVPDAIAAVVSSPNWIPGMGIRKNDPNRDGGKDVKKLREELDEILASNCPLCESVIVGLDRPFVNEGEVDVTWAL